MDGFYTFTAVPKAKGVLDVDKVYFYAKENAKAHRTLRYELVHRQPETPILRRGQPFTLLIRFSDDRAYDSAKDVLRLNLNFGKCSTVVTVIDVQLQAPITGIKWTERKSL